MKHDTSRSTKNITLECCKLLASLFVVFLHVPFPGRTGTIIDTLSRFAVPFFFLITGYYNHNAPLQSISRRMRHILKLTVFSCLFYIVWYSLQFFISGWGVLSYLASVFTLQKFLDWLLMNLNPFSDHLWYLSALLYCYLLFWCYTALLRKNTGYLLLYILGFLLFFCTLALDGPISTFVMYIPHYIYRNGWFMGSASFILGVFLHELFSKYPQILKLSTPWQIFLILSGLILGIWQKRTIGAAEISLGAVFAASCLLLFGLTHPVPPPPRTNVSPKWALIQRPFTSFIWPSLPRTSLSCTHCLVSFSVLRNPISGHF